MTFLRKPRLTRILLASAALPVVAQAQESAPDMLRFSNGDVLHGRFGGLDEQLIWHHPDAEDATRYRTRNLSQVIFSGGRANDPVKASPTAHLINGDEIPGQIIGLEGETLLFESAMAGHLRISRKHLASLEPNPHGGTLHYTGPFEKDGWVMLTDPPEVTDNAAESEDPSPWIHYRAAFESQGTTPLVRLIPDLPDRGRIRFKMAWKNRLNFSLAFHCDFERPLLAKADEEDANDQPVHMESLTERIQEQPFQAIPWLEPNNSNYAITYGTGYVLTMYSSYPSLRRTSFGKEGEPQVSDLRSPRTRAGRQESGSAQFDLRYDRPNASITLYVDGEYVAQWTDPDGYLGSGNGLAFCANNQCRLRLSDIRISGWNGLRDSALSMVHDERDVILMTNGTDRFSGLVNAINEQQLTLRNAYAEMTLPLEKISAIHFNRRSLIDPTEVEWPATTARLDFQPLGHLNLIPTSADQKTLKAQSPLLGPDLSIHLDAASLLELRKAPHDHDSWLDEF